MKKKQVEQKEIKNVMFEEKTTSKLNAVAKDFNAWDYGVDLIYLGQRFYYPHVASTLS